jgi:hypothetical protein
MTWQQDTTVAFTAAISSSRVLGAAGPGLSGVRGSRCWFRTRRQVFVHGGPAVTVAPEHDGLSLADGLFTSASADHGRDVVAEDGGVTEVLDEGLRGGAGLDAEVILAFPLPP